MGVLGKDPSTDHPLSMDLCYCSMPPALDMRSCLLSRPYRLDGVVQDREVNLDCQYPVVVFLRLGIGFGPQGIRVF